MTAQVEGEGVGDGATDGEGDTVSAGAVGDDDGEDEGVVAPVVLAARPHPVTIRAIAPMTTILFHVIARDITQDARRSFLGGTPAPG